MNTRTSTSTSTLEKKSEALGTPIEQIRQLSKYKKPLASLGYLTLEHLIYAAQVAGHELSDFLHVDLDELIKSVPVAAATIPAAALDSISSAEYPLGFAVETFTPPDTASQIPILPESVSLTCTNLISQMPPVRDQGDRGTCVAHAALAAYEHYLQRSGAYVDMSEQFCYWNCKKHDRHPQTAGTWLSVAMSLLKRDGCCPETTWPYVSAPKPMDEGQGPPPGGSQAQALQFRIRNSNQLAPTSVLDLKTELAQSRVVAFSIPVFNAWYRNPWVAYTGEIVLPPPGSVRVGGHAMCLVGCIDLPDQPQIGGGKFILRNSWGEKKWGIKCPYGA